MVSCCIAAFAAAIFRVAAGGAGLLVEREMIFAGRCVGEFVFMVQPYPAAVLRGELANRFVILNEVKSRAF